MNRIAMIKLCAQRMCAKDDRGGSLVAMLKEVRCQVPDFEQTSSAVVMAGANARSAPA